MKRATGGWSYGRGHFSAQCRWGGPAGLPGRGRGQKGPGVGMPRVVVEGGGRGLFDDLAQIHHGHPVAHLLDQPQVVGDQQVGQTESLLQVDQEIDDHINMIPDNPLRGENDDRLGPRFPDMSQPYNKEMNGMLKEIAKEQNITLHEGVYTPVAGPNLETRAEYRYLRRIGTDAVGMSTAPEVIVANHMGLPCVAISVLTDECDPDNLAPVSIAEILEIAGRAEKDLTKLYMELVKRI